MSDKIKGNLAHVDQLVSEGRFDEALGIVEQYITQSTLTYADRAAYNLLKSNILRRLGRFTEALSLAEEVFQESQQRGRRLQAVDALIAMTEVLLRLGRYNEIADAITQGEQMLHELVNAPEPTPKAVSGLRARLRRILGRGRQSQPSYALSSADQINPSETPNRQVAIAKRTVKFLHFKGAISMQKSDFEQAGKYFQQCLEIFEELGETQRIASALNNLGVVYSMKGAWDQALDYYQRCLTLREQGDKQQYAVTLSNICEIHRRKGDLNQSLECYQKVLRTHKEIGNNYHIAVVLHNIGVVYWQQGELAQARVHLEQSLVLREEIKNKIEISDSLFFLISVAIDQKAPDTAQQYFQKLQEIRNQEDDKTIHQRCSVAEALLLKISTRARDRVRAEEILAQVVDTGIGDLEVTTIALLHLCDVLLVELRTSGDTTVLVDVQSRVGQLLELAKEQRSNWLLAETYVLQARLALIELNLQEARRLLTQAQIMADEHGLHRLAMMISREHDALLKQLSQWEALIERQASLQERIEMARLEELVVRMIRKRAEDIPEEPEEPVLLLVLDSTGISLFSKRFIGEEVPDEQLIAGFLSAIDGFSRDAFSASGSLERIKHQDYTLLIHAQKPLLFCYVFKGQSYGARQRLTAFLTALKSNDAVWYAITTRPKDAPLPHTATFDALVTEIFQPSTNRV